MSQNFVAISQYPNIPISILLMKSRRAQSIFRFAMICGIAFFANILANFYHTNFDLTGEKRFTLSPPTRNLLDSLDERVYVQILLEGDFPAGFKRLQTASREMLDDFRSENSLIDYQFEDPNKGTIQQINERRKNLAEEGIIPVNLKVRGEGGSSQSLVYPIAIFNRGQKRVVVKLLENESASLHPEQVINNSVSLLEYKFANALKKLDIGYRQIILFTRGHGELDDLQTADLEQNLRQFYDTDRITLDSVVALPPKKCALLIVAKPRTAFSESEKFKIDQYVMNGGKMLWLIDRIAVSLDSMRISGIYIPNDYPLNLEDLLYKYGARVQPDLVVDLQCTKIPLRTGQVGNAPQLELFPWYYHAAVSPTTGHPVVKNLDRVELDFCSSIDTIRTKTPVKKTVLLQSSKYSRLQFSPVELSFDILKFEPDPKKFDKGSQFVAVLLEGIFPSNYENRVSAEMLAGLESLKMPYLAASKPTQMIVVSDGDVAANRVLNREKKEFDPLGFNRFERSTYSNKDFLLNSIEYLTDPNGVIAARTKDVKLRLLDAPKAEAEKMKWQVVNIAVPLVFLGLFGWGFRWWRQRKYGKA